LGNASITKKALIMLDKRIRELGKEDEVKILVTVHDEIVCEVIESFATEFKDILSSTMIEAAKVWIKKVPIFADAYVSNHWEK
jgi:DNA polymerase I-like protein with 3'-5' exonuclease and polymerase domains